MASESGVGEFLRASTSLSEILLPRVESSSSAPSVMVQIDLHADVITGFTISRCCGVSTMIATAPESARIHSTCSALDVS